MANGRAPSPSITGTTSQSRSRSAEAAPSRSERAGRGADPTPAPRQTEPLRSPRRSHRRPSAAAAPACVSRRPHSVALRCRRRPGADPCRQAAPGPAPGHFSAAPAAASPRPVRLPERRAMRLSGPASAVPGWIARRAARAPVIPRPPRHAPRPPPAAPRLRPPRPARPDCRRRPGCLCRRDRACRSSPPALRPPTRPGLVGQPARGPWFRRGRIWSLDSRSRKPPRRASPRRRVPACPLRPQSPVPGQPIYTGPVRPGQP